MMFYAHVHIQFNQWFDLQKFSSANIGQILLDDSCIRYEPVFHPSFSFKILISLRLLYPLYHFLFFYTIRLPSLSSINVKINDWNHQRILIQFHFRHYHLWTSVHYTLSFIITCNLANTHRSNQIGLNSHQLPAFLV